MNEDKLQKYYDWLQKQNPAIEFSILSPIPKNGDTIATIDGLLLTGGGDVHPGFYGREELMKWAKDVKRDRDQFEFDVINQALESDLPILGVCRGMQVMNVALGGSLHGDLKSDGFNDHSATGGVRPEHDIEIEPNSLLSGLAGGLNQRVNSYHHQAVDELGRGLIPTAVSSDGVVEAAEWSVKEGMPFLLLVQWHPERSLGDNDVFAANLAKIFLREIEFTYSNKTTQNSRT
jgi:putative glutamine amidotransferase